MRPSPSIFVLGSFVVACSVRVERLPRPGETLSAKSFTMEPGGKGFNQIVAVTRLGALADGLLAVGRDPSAAMAEAALEAEHLNAAMLVRHSGATGAGVGLIDDEGENAIVVHSGANCLLNAADVAWAAERIRAAEIVTAQFEIADEPIETGFALAKAAGATTILNPSPYRSIRPSILTNTDYLIMNENEAEAFMGRPWKLEKDGGARLDDLRLGATNCVITLGRKGAVALCGGETIYQPAFPVTALDSIGAGDAFLSGFVVALGQGATLQMSLESGVACGAITVERSGVLSALPTADELREFLKNARA